MKKERDLIGYSGLVTYVVRCDGFLKVGRTESIDRRLRQLQLGCPYEVDLLSFVIGDDESQAHRTLAENGVIRVTGEWYEDTAQARDVLISVGVLGADYRIVD